MRLQSSLFAMLAMAAACGAPQTRSAADAGDLGLLVESTELGPAFVAQQRVRASFRGRSFVFQAIIQLEGGVLSVVALTPQGQKAFVIEQRGRAVRHQSYVKQDLPFSANHILIDIHRTYFRAVAKLRPDGEHVLADDVEPIRELWRGGRLVRRSLGGDDHGNGALARITYGPGDENLFGRPVRYENLRRGYELEVKPIGFQLLESDAAENQ